MKKTTFLIFAFLLPFLLTAQQGFQTITNLNPVPVSTDTGEKPQAKVWFYAGKHWAVLPNSSGTHLWRLDGKTWTNVLRLSTRTSSKADTKMVGNAAHILLFQGASSQLVSVEYSEALGTYQLWSKRTSTVGLNLKTSTETATIDIDGKGRMWLAYDGTSDINVIWSDSPYHTWSTPITLANTVNTDDICAVIALPGKVGVFWSDQNAKRFVFRTHMDGANPSSWSANEVPASQSAQNYGAGMADDHMNLAVASDGTLYSAVKTGYDNSSYPSIALLVRRPSGIWDNLYNVSNRGTRPIVVLNEELNKVRVIFPEQNGGGVMYYRESSASNISFGAELKLMDGSSNNPTSSKDNFTSEVVVLASTNTHAVGVLASEGSLSPELQPPLLSSPANFSTNVSTSPALSWNASTGAQNYEVQVSIHNNFTSLAFHQNALEETSVAVSGLSNNTTYYWRARAMNNEKQSDWSTVWRFTTTTASSGSSLIAHWKMDEGSGTTLIDGTNYGNHGVISGSPTWVAGVDGQAIRFNGSNKYATVEDNNSIDIAGAVTIAMWVKPEKRATQYLIKKAAHNAVDGYELALSNPGQFFFRFNQKSSGDTYRLNSNVNYPTSGDTWMHVAATFNGTTIKMYINGKENNSITFTSISSIGINTLPLSIGAESDGFRGLQGALDDVRMYNFALSAAEVYELANPTSTPPVAVAVPVLLTPANSSTDVATQPTLSWNSAEGADTYSIEVAANSNFSNPVFNQTGIVGTSVLVNTLSEGTIYYWRVRGVNTTSQSDWSQVWNFTTVISPVAVAVPVLLSPTNAATEVTTPTNLSWNTAEGAETYSVQVSANSNFSNPIFNQTGIVGTSVVVNSLAEGTTYFWRVRGVNNSGQSDWSLVWSFTTVTAPVAVSVPVLNSPSNTATGVATQPTLSWNTASGAETYSVQVSANSNFSNPVFNQTGVLGTSVLVNSLVEGTTYYWRVRGVNTTGQSDWSQVWNFTTITTPVAVAVPVLLSPANAAMGVALQPALSWNSAEGAETYSVEVAATSNFSNPVFNQTGIVGTSVLVNTLSEGTIYYWRVRGVNATSQSDWSQVWNFTVLSQDPVSVLRALWKMEEGSGSILVDASEFGNNATITGNVSRVLGVEGMAIHFNGNQYATVENSSSLNFTQSITIAAWIKPQAKGNQILVRKTDNSGANGFELALAPNGRISFQVNQTSNRFFSTANYPTNGNTWIHIAATFDGSVMKIFINGVENSSKTISPGSLYINDWPLFIGAAAGGSNSYRGAMDEVYIYSVALQSSEIFNLRNGGSSIRLASNSIKSSNSETGDQIPIIEEFKEEFFAAPNPLSSTTSIYFSFSRDMEYSMTLYDGKGAKIKEIAQGDAKARENYKFDFDGSSLPDGIYLLRLQNSAGETKTIRLLSRK